MNLKQISFNDKYERVDGEPYLTGTQALVKVAMLQINYDQQGEKLKS